jgi:hypothetical protein
MFGFPAARRSPRALMALLVGTALVWSAVPASGAGSRGGPPSDPPIDGVSVGKRLPALVPGPQDALARALQRGRLTPATYALERATSLFAIDAVRARFGTGVQRPEPRLATIYLRDLAIRLKDLRGDDLRRAERLLARPSDDSKQPVGEPKYGTRPVTRDCDAHVCVHHVSGGKHAATGGFAATVLMVMGEVWQKEIVEMGYRKPKSDASSKNDGGDGRLDVYLAELREQGLFGYCTTDDPNAKKKNYPYYDFSAYCVLDNDYVGYGYANPVLPLKVTAAHEFFHAVQFAYDAAEDAHFMEGTATWIEGEVYDGIDDNLFYLRTSPLSNPLVPLDQNSGLRVYGTWIWWRFLSEYFGSPDIIKEIWKRADASQNGRDMYSTQAAAATIAKQKIGGKSWRFRWAFADFGAWNAATKRFYEEGGKYRAQKVQATATISGSNRSYATGATQRHLTSRYVVLRRGAGVKATAKLRVAFDGPAYTTGPEASVVVIRKTGRPRIVRMKTNAAGDGALRVGFGSDVARVVVVTTNASSRFKNCWSDPRWRWSCAGVPVDDGTLYRFGANLVQ